MFSLKMIKSVNFENLAAHSWQSDTLPVGLQRIFHEVDNVHILRNGHRRRFAGYSQQVILWKHTWKRGKI